MKATGIIRRIDELGRIVIPKEIRKSLRIREGESLEIFVEENDKIVLKKHSLLGKIEDFAQDLTDSVYSYLKENVIITDNDKIIAATGNSKKNILNKDISEELEFKLKRHEEILEKHKKTLELTDEYKIDATYAISPIIVNSDCVGLVIVASSENILDESTFKVVQIMSQFIKNSLEV